MCQCRTVCLAVGLHPVLHLRLVTALSHSLEAYLGVGDIWLLSVIGEHVDFVWARVVAQVDVQDALEPYWGTR